MSQGKRLRLAREQAGYKSARAAALDNGWPESTYRAHEAGTRTIGQDDAERYAKRFRHKGAKVTGQSVLYGDQPAPQPLDEGGLSDAQTRVVRLVFQAFLQYAVSDRVLKDKLQDPAYQAALARIAAQYARSPRVHEAALHDDQAALRSILIALEMQQDQ